MLLQWGRAEFSAEGAFKRVKPRSGCACFNGAALNSARKVEEIAADRFNGKASMGPR